MSNLLKTPKIPTPQEPESVEQIQQIKVDATETARKRKRSLIGQGRQSTILSGVQTLLKKRLGE